MKQLAFILLLFIAVTSTAQDRFAINHGPYLQHLDETGVTIIWTTNKNAVSWVELAPNDSTHFYLVERPKYYSAEYGFKDVGTVHSVRISGLKPATKYRYRVYSQEVLSHEGTNVLYGTVAASNVYRAKPLEFTTIDKSKAEVSFLIVNDIHGRNDLLENLLTKGDVLKNDFVFFNGDMVNNFTSEDQLFADFMDTGINTFAKEKPMYYSRGNHETRGNFANAFPEYFASPEGKLYYLLRQGPVCFVVMDCGEDKPDSDIEYSGIVAFDQYRDVQKGWLEQALKSKDFTEAPVKVAIIHMPPFGGWHGEEDIKNKFIPLLDKAGIDIMFCGHLHRYIKQPAGQLATFPIIVNSNVNGVKAVAKATGLDVKIFNEKGETVDSFVISAN